MVDDNIKKIIGYRELSKEEIFVMNKIKHEATDVGELILDLNDMESVDKRWLAIAKTDLQKGFMALTRAVAKPESF